MFIEEFMEEFGKFLSQSKDIGRFYIVGNYDMHNGVFEAALKNFLETGESKISEYALLLEARRAALSGDTAVPEKEMELLETIISNMGFWNIHTLLAPEDIVAIKDYIVTQKRLKEHKQSHEYRRIEACKYTSDHKTRKVVFKRDGKFCKKCKAKERLELDHILPVSRGGKDTLENLQVLCKACNSSKGNNMELSNA